MISSIPAPFHNKDIFFNKIVGLIKDKLGFDCSRYNTAYIRRRINSRIITYNLPQDSYEDYYKIISREDMNGEELRKLFDALTINVTQFFRDIPLWEKIRTDVFPKIIAEKRNNGEKELLIWSCGCSSGEEPYSIAILLNELLAKGNSPATSINSKSYPISPKIIATDIDDISLKKAETGVYSFAAFTSTPSEYLVKYFHQIPPQKNEIRYEIDDSIKKFVEFRRHNFFKEPPPYSDFDMIFCRNVIIYFTPPAKDTLIRIFYDSLKEHGWLVIGKSEILFTIKAGYNFYIYDAQERIYRKERRREQRKVSTHNEKRVNWWQGYTSTAHTK